MGWRIRTAASSRLQARKSASTVFGKLVGIKHLSSRGSSGSLTACVGAFKRLDSPAMGRLGKTPCRRSCVTRKRDQQNFNEACRNRAREELLLEGPRHNK